MKLSGLPVYNATIPDDESGMLMISLVDDPATMVNFQAFNKEKKLMKYEVENEEKRLVRGPIMLANTPIYRISPKGSEYFIQFTPDTIRFMAEKYLMDNNQENVDTNHNEELVSGVNMVQFYIKDTANGINPKGFENTSDGSLFGEFKVNNDDVWNEIKDGTYKGFSLMGYFGEEQAFEVDEMSEINEIMDLIERINKKINSK